VGEKFEHLFRWRGARSRGSFEPSDEPGGIERCNHRGTRLDGRHRSDEVIHFPWNGHPIAVPADSVVCLYPKPRSAAEGAWLIDIVGDREFGRCR